MMVLYEASIKRVSVGEILAERRENPGAESALTKLSIEIVQGVAEKTALINAVISHHLRDFRLERLARLDKALLQMGIWELLFSDAEREVVLEQARLLAEKYCDARSVDFVFALLANVEPSDAQLTPLVPLPAEIDTAAVRTNRNRNNRKKPSTSGTGSRERTYRGKPSSTGTPSRQRTNRGKPSTSGTGRRERTNPNRNKREKSSSTRTPSQQRTNREKPSTSGTGSRERTNRGKPSTSSTGSRERTNRGKPLSSQTFSHQSTSREKPSSTGTDSRQKSYREKPSTSGTGSRNRTNPNRNNRDKSSPARTARSQPKRPR